MPGNQWRLRVFLGAQRELVDVRCVHPTRLPLLGRCGQSYLKGNQRASCCDGDSPKPKATGGGLIIPLVLGYK